MAPLPLADNFLAGSILSLVLPIALLIALGVWFVVGVARIPDPDPETTLVGEPPSVPTPETPDSGGDAA